MGKLLNRLKELDKEQVDFNAPADSTSINDMVKGDKPVENHWAERRCYTYLQLAIICRDYEAVEFLLVNKKVDVNKSNQPSTTWEKPQRPLQTALYGICRAAGGGKRWWQNPSIPKIYNLLLQHGACFESETKKSWFDEAIKAGVLIIDFSIGEKNFARNSHTNNLHKAAMNGNERELNRLLEGDRLFEINTLDFVQYNALHYAIEDNKPKAAKVLIAKGIEVNAVTKYGETALHIAVKNKSLACVEAILNSEQAEVNKTNAEGKTALDLICDDTKSSPGKFTEDWKTICRLLLENGALINAEQTELLAKKGLDVPLAKSVSVDLRLQREAKQREINERQHRGVTGQAIERAGAIENSHIAVNNQNEQRFRILLGRSLIQERQIAQLTETVSVQQRQITQLLEVVRALRGGEPIASIEQGNLPPLPITSQTTRLNENSFFAITNGAEVLPQVSEEGVLQFVPGLGGDEIS